MVEVPVSQDYIFYSQTKFLNLIQYSRMMITGIYYQPLFTFFIGHNIAIGLQRADNNFLQYQSLIILPF